MNSLTLLPVTQVFQTFIRVYYKQMILLFQDLLPHSSSCSCVSRPKLMNTQTHFLLVLWMDVAAGSSDWMIDESVTHVAVVCLYLLEGKSKMWSDESSGDVCSTFKLSCFTRSHCVNVFDFVRTCSSTQTFTHFQGQKEHYHFSKTSTFNVGLPLIYRI